MPHIDGSIRVNQWGPTYQDFVDGDFRGTFAEYVYNHEYNNDNIGRDRYTGVYLTYGGDQPHNNLQPYQVTLYIIKAINIQPTEEPQNIIDIVYPIGSIYISMNDTSPATLFNVGTWERIPVGRFLVSAGGGTNPTTDTNTYLGRGNYTGDVNWYPVNETGGENDHQLSISEMPRHGHLTEANWGEPLYPNWGNKSGWGFTAQYLNGNGGTWETTLSGDGVYHNNVPPYLALYMWKRTA